MPVWMSILILLVAFYVMAEVVDGVFIKSLDNIARWLKMPPSVAGATLLAFGTSAPEISTALIALFLAGAHPATGIGSIVGSAIFQILVVIGFAAMIRSATLDWRPVVRDGTAYAVSIGLLIWFIHDGRFTLLEGALLVGAYFVYLGVMVIWARRVKEADPEEAPGHDSQSAPPGKLRAVLGWVQMPIVWPIRLVLAPLPDPDKRPAWTVPVFLLSLGLIGYACYWLVIAAEALADTMGVPHAIVALTILAGGTSVPELISSAVVARQGRGDMAIANAIGSNVFDILISLGLPVLIYCALYGDLTELGGANVTSSILLLFATLIAVLALLVARRFRVGRCFGALLIAVYGVYVWAAYAGWIG